MYGSSPGIAGQQKADPAAAILLAGTLLGHRGHADAAARIEKAVVADLADSGLLTRSPHRLYGFRLESAHSKGIAMSHSSPLQDGLVGNRWVLVGGVVYLLEWVAIIWVGVVGVGEFVTRGSSGAEVVKTYADHPDAMFAMAGWFAIVLLGRILLFIGLRQALADSGHRHLLLDLAVAAAAVSVTIEIASYGLAAGATVPAAAGDEALTLAIDQAAVGLNLMIAGGLGVAILSAAYGMWRSGLFPVPLNVIGAISGLAIVGAQLTVSPALEILFNVFFVFPLLFWVWMLWAGAVCWRSTSREPRSSAAAC